MFSLCILKANKEENPKELKILFKGLFLCMKVISENENEESKKLLAQPEKLKGFGFLAKSCLDTV